MVIETTPAPAATEAIHPLHEYLGSTGVMDAADVPVLGVCPRAATPAVPATRMYSTSMIFDRQRCAWVMAERLAKVRRRGP